MIRNFPTDFYMPNRTDEVSGTTKIIIEPNSENVVLRMNYKLRDTFKFMVYGGLTIRNLEFDALDSVIDLN